MKKALQGVRLPRNLPLRVKANIVSALIEEHQTRLLAAQEELLTPEALQARKEAAEDAQTEIPAPEGQ